MSNGSVLIAGASFAGLASAYWMARAGYDVTVVEVEPVPRSGGTPVNIKGPTVDVVRRMGLYDEVVANRLVMRAVEFWGPDGLVEHADMLPAHEQDTADPDFEIERDVLTRMLFDLVRDDVEIVFNESIAAMQQVADRVDVRLASGQQRSVYLVLGCDGIHSSVRSQWFGPEATYSHYLGAYGSVMIVPRLLVEQGTVAMYQAPGRSVVLSAYHGRTDIITLFSSQERIAYDHRDEAEQRRLLRSQFRDLGWRMPELLEEIDRADNLYFGELAQIRMPRWDKGRVALVGDAAYCASPAAGKGGSLAIEGAAALGMEFAEHGNDHVAAFRAYNEGFRPYVDEVQEDAARFCEGIALGTLADSDP